MHHTKQAATPIDIAACYRQIQSKTNRLYSIPNRSKSACCSDTAIQEIGQWCD
jgi:hypothetical protein